MADLLIRLNKNFQLYTNTKNEKIIAISPELGDKLLILGQRHTFFIKNKEKDFIISFGYLRDTNEESISNSLKRILDDFDENKIAEYKKRLAGQFVLLIKKGKEIFLFSDFFGSRNIFYSADKLIISTSFNIIENIIKPSGGDLCFDKILEYVATRTFYPSWLGRETINRKLKWLMPYEYIKINLQENSMSIKKLSFYINNNKSKDSKQLAIKLKRRLEDTIKIPEYIEYRVASSITGGIDSRLVALIVSGYFKNPVLRMAYSNDKYDSKIDLRIAEKLAKIIGIPLDVYNYNEDSDYDTYYIITEGLAPIFNKTITPIIERANNYKIGFGGSYASELFEPLPYVNAYNFIDERLKRSKKLINANSLFWETLYSSFHDCMQEIRSSINLEENIERDYLRIFYLYHTARYSSHLVRAFNDYGLQIEPYGSFYVLELALQTDDFLFGSSNRSISGEKRIQKIAITSINESAARQLAFKEFRPLVPLSIKSLGIYLYGFYKKALYSLRSRIMRLNKKKIVVELPNATYISDGFEINLIRKIEEKYGITLSIRDAYSRK